MAKKTRQGYWVHGHFVHAGSDLDLELKRELKGDTDYSRADAKRDSDALQALGEGLLNLRRSSRDKLDLPEKLIEALDEHKRLDAHGARRRQMQFIGKLMRQLDDDTVAAIRAAVDAQHQGSAAETQALHEAERWRDGLIASDDTVTDWLNQHPDTDVQALRSLIRQARKDAQAPSAGDTPRHGKAYRELFKIVRRALDADPEETEDPDHEL
jgi:ribosome-associated protein